MQLTDKLLNELQRRLKVGTRRGVHLNAVPARSRYKFDLSRLSHIQKEMPNEFITALLTETLLKFKVSWKENVPDLNTLEEEEQTHLIRINGAFENLINQTEAIESEKGINTFGFGFPILIRRDQSDRKVTVAPILIWSLRLKRTKEFNTWVITRNEEDPIYFNEVLINHLQSDTGIEIEQISNELLADGLISKDELLDICSSLIEAINTNPPDNLKEIFETKITQTTAIRSKAQYDKLLSDSTNAIIDFSGLFSIFEVQKQNIINDYNRLLDLEGLSINLADLDRHTFQPISSVETDPSQQSILHSLESKRNVLIQGPPGTGKSQTLSAILINALENHKKILIVCEKRTALEVLHNGLKDRGLDYHCVLIQDIIKDRKVVVNSVRDRVDNSDYKNYRHVHAKESLDSLIRKASKLIESINEKHQKLDEKLLGSKSWTWIVGELLAELNGIDKKVNLQLPSVYLKYTPVEFEELTSLVEKAETLYAFYQPYESNPFINHEKLIGHNPYLIEQTLKDDFQIYAQSLRNLSTLEETYQTEYFKIRQAQLERQLEKAAPIENTIKALIEKHRQNDDFLNETKTKGFGYKLSSLFSSEKKQVLQDQKIINNSLFELANHYDYCKDLSTFEIAITIDATLKKLALNKKQIEQLRQAFPAKIKKEFAQLDLLNFNKADFQTSSLTDLKVVAKELKAKFIADGWTMRKPDYSSLKALMTDMKAIIELNEAYLSSEDDRFSTEFNWFQFYQGLSSQHQAIVNALKGQFNWRKAFLIHYLNSMLIQSANIDLPTNDKELKELDTLLSGLEQQQLRYIKEYWFSKQIDLKKNFEQQNPSLGVENLYNKRSSKRFKRLSLRQIVQYDADLFTTFFPIVLTSPDVASNLFKGMNGYFDIVMFDEASQLRLEDNLPALLKGQQIIIAGDEHQMPPSNYFSKVFDGIVEDEDDIEEEEIYIDKDNLLLSCESLLDFGLELNFAKRHLDFHYRSKHPYLIDFSNYAFYNQRLKPLPNVFEYNPIKYIQVGGTFSDHVNEAEAEMVLSILENNIHPFSNEHYPSVGIATFNIAQRNLIKRKLLERQKNAPGSAFTKKIQALEKQGLFIKNLENIQGDERDVIILSTTYGRSADGRFANRFGPINHSKGYKLLNVIITRAKYKVYVCSSIPEEVFLNYQALLQLEGANNRRAVFFAYLAYTKAVSEGNDDLRLGVLTALSEQSKRSASFDMDNFGLLESPFEEEVYQRLADDIGEMKLIPQMKVSEFRIDLVYDPKIAGVPKIAIECDGAKYHSSREAYLYDQHRQKILEQHGFVFHRIWSTNWWRNPKRETEHLLKFIKEVEASVRLDARPDATAHTAFTDQIKPLEVHVADQLKINTNKEAHKIQTIENHSQKSIELIEKKVQIGSSVKIQSLKNSKSLKVEIVEKANPKATKNGFYLIGADSLLGKALIGQPSGAIVSFGTPTKQVKILDILTPE